MCKFYGYIRVSTETQAETGYGLETQRTQIKEYCKRNNISLTQIFEDAGISGNLSDTASDDEINKRAGLIELLATAETNDTVIVLNTSRLWRSEATKFLVRRELKKHSVKIISIEQPKYDLYSADPNDFLFNGLMELLDSYERMTISLKLAKGRTTKAQKGSKPAGVCPLGYQYSADKKSVEVVPAEASIVRRMFSLAQTGSSLQEIADTLNAESSRTRHGKEFSKQAVSVILHNRFYLGELTHAGKPVSGNHQPIISSVQFGKVAKALERKQK